MMATGVFVNSGAVLVGGLLGVFFGDRIPDKISNNLTMIFGCAACAMGIMSITKMVTLPAVILALIIGTVIGELLNLESGIAKSAKKLEHPLKLIAGYKETEVQKENYIETLVSIVVLFVVSGMGIFGALEAGLTGNNTILFTKAILDLFTAIIFATSLGYIVSIIAIPQFIVLFLLYLLAGLIMPLTTPFMLADFASCGGIIMFATGMRICGIKSFPIANMLPAMLLVMPFSFLWMKYFL